MRAGLVIAALFLAQSAVAADCAACHPREADAWAGSAHAHALQRPLESDFYRMLPGRPIGEARGGFLLTYRPLGDTLRVTAARGDESASAAIQWVFGAGRRAETPVAAEGSRYIEHRISWYAGSGRFDLTMGHAAGISPSAASALGRQESAGEAEKCFGCHASGGLPDSSSFEPGVRCERCHQHAGVHAKSGGPVSNPGKLSAKAIVRLCAECHRDRPEGDPDAPINVRYQPARLMRSQCFRLGGASCITCHDPHANAVEDAAFYRGKCLGCHADQKSQGDCLECHMPRVSPVAHMAFTDHFIRVVAR